MKGKVVCIIGILISIYFLHLGCLTYPKYSEPSGNSNLTVGMVKTKIIKNKTTQAEILELFGAPNIITRNSSNLEVWNYNRMSFQSVSGTEGGVIIFWAGSRAMTTTTTKSFDLIIVFDENDIVTKYSVIATKF